MTTVLACVDASAYAGSVCDHSAWLAGRLEANVLVLHAREDSERGSDLSQLIDHASSRIVDHGVSSVHTCVCDGPLVPEVLKAAPSIVVMGKRGASSTSERTRLGEYVDDMILGADLPVCLTSQYFLPPQRLLIVTDDSLDRTRGLDFVLANPGLSELQTDILVVAVNAQRAAMKVESARTAFREHTAEIHAIEAPGLEGAVQRFMATGSADLIVVSRAVLMSDGTVALSDIGTQSLWSWRCPVIVC